MGKEYIERKELSYWTPTRFWLQKKVAADYYKAIMQEETMEETLEAGNRPKIQLTLPQMWS